MTTADPADVLRPLRRIRQVRQFTDQPVDGPAIDAIVDVGRWSGSSSNSQPWRFIVLRDVDLVRRMATMDMPHSRALTTAMAAIVVVVPTTGSTMSFAYDDGRASERMLIAAQTLGLGAGLLWVSQEARSRVAEALGIPDGWMPRSVLALGHPTTEALAPKNPPGQARRPRSRMVSEGRWSDELAS